MGVDHARETTVARMVLGEGGGSAYAYQREALVLN